MKIRIASGFISFVGAALLVMTQTVNAQEIMKHPRVVELEDNLKNSASEYIKTRFPNVPFMVTIRIDPLRRDFTIPNDAYAPDLPYFNPDESEEIKDEWDNPQVPLKALINRVRRIQVSIIIPAKLKEAEVTELKENIFTDLHLTPARDEVTVSRRDWAIDEIPWYSVYVVGAVLFALLLGLLMINRTSANKIARALSEMKLQGPANSGGNMIASQASVPEFEQKASSQSQELKFNDPLKMKELASRHVQFLISSKNFPNHHDIFMLDKLGQDHPEKLGAILSEFPAEMQRALFSYSGDLHWIEALHSPGFLDFECLEMMQALTQNVREKNDLEWDHAVLAVWRLNDVRTQFIRGLAKEEAFALLADMPKAVAVSEARKCFPGSWAALLDPNFKAPVITAGRAKEIQSMAFIILPLNDITMVKRYKAEKELLDYLLTVDPSEERDIYGASQNTSMIHRIRPPFYNIFDQPPEVLQWFVPLISLDKWALALFNLPKDDRVKIDSHMSEKQKFLLIERFKKYDQQNPDKSSIGAAREKVGALLKQSLEEKNNATQEPTTPKPDEIENENKKTAA